MAVNRPWSWPKLRDELRHTIAGTQALAQLGCTQVQGFGIGKPMPFEETLDWMRAHEAKLLDTPKIRGHHSG
jgi:predicted signal transduction protein with EAL and GGDEF domain